ncbi:tRNA acetyltransferase TAN1-like protein [Elsinoe fawcettii]|nr:tRNA acetyltransferase TAN1-like protein [Elsinoe fawcettii]
MPNNIRHTIHKPISLKTHLEQMKKSWRVPHKNGPPPRENLTLRPGDSGIWITCQKNKERKCIAEMCDLIGEYTRSDGQRTDASGSAGPGVEDEDGGADDIENEIKQEVSDIKVPSKEQPFDPIFLDMPCVVFFRIKAPVDPVALTKNIIEDAAANPSRKRTRCTMRLEPSTLTGYAAEDDLERVAKEVLAPHFHAENQEPKKFAIRPTIRNHNKLNRDTIIKKVASLVGSKHSVDLKNYDALILVNVLKNICGISVVGPDFDRLKRFNLQEIFEPSMDKVDAVKQNKLEQGTAKADEANTIADTHVGEEDRVAGSQET